MCQLFTQANLSRPSIGAKLSRPSTGRHISASNLSGLVLTFCLGQPTNFVEFQPTMLRLNLKLRSGPTFLDLRPGLNTQPSIQAGPSRPLSQDGPTRPSL